MSWQRYTVTLRLRGTRGKRGTAIRRLSLYANSHEQALERAKEKLVNAASYEVRTTYGP